MTDPRFEKLWLAVCALLLAAVATWALQARFGLIASRGTYPSHRDERHLSEHAWHIASTGDLNPHFFNYGSLPIYTTAIAMRLGFLEAKARGEVSSESEVTSVFTPHYSHRSVSLPPRYLFATFSVVGLVCAGLLAYRAYRRPILLFLVPCVLLVSQLYTRLSWSYLNVDIFAAVLSFVALAYLTNTLDATGWRQRILWPAVLCGAATATKYNSGLLGLPFLVALWLPGQPRPVTRSLALGAATLAVFLLCEPYAVLDFGAFIKDVTFEIHHYKTGHTGRDGDPGLPQLRYYLGILHGEYGTQACALGAIGLLGGLVRERRMTLMLLAFPLAMLLHMSTNRVHFPRTILPFFAMFAVFVALGATTLIDAARSALNALSLRLRATWLSPGLANALGVALACTALAIAFHDTRLFEKVRAQNTATTDSRLRVSAWIRDNVRGPCVVAVPNELDFDPSGITSRCELAPFKLRRGSQKAAEALLKSTRGHAARYLLVPDWDFDRRRPAGRSVAEDWDALPLRVGNTTLAIQFGGRTVLIDDDSVEGASPALRLFRLGSESAPATR